MTTTRYFSSSDSGAPVITGQVGTIYNALKAMLVGTSGVAYGSGGSAKPSCGWSILFDNSSNKIVFQNSVTSGATGCCVRVLDNGTSGAINAQFATFFVYASMSNIDTGVDPAPTTSQSSVGIGIYKSATANSTARSWFAWGDEKTFYLTIQNGDGTGAYAVSFIGFGDFSSLVNGDTYNYFAAGNTGTSFGFNTDCFQLGSAPTHLFLGRGTITTTGAVNPTNYSILPPGTATGIPGNSAGINYPDSVMSGVAYATPVFHYNNTFRGVLRGIKIPLHKISSSFSNGAVLPSYVGAPSGSTLRAATFQGSSGAGAIGMVAVESALSWG